MNKNEQWKKNEKENEKINKYEQWKKMKKLTKN